MEVVSNKSHRKFQKQVVCICTNMLVVSIFPEIFFLSFFPIVLSSNYIFIYIYTSKLNNGGGTMSKELSLNQKNYLIQALKSNIRLSTSTNTGGSRKFNQFRPIDIKLSNTRYGSVELSLGKTKVMVNITSRITEPYQDRPFEGIMTINCEIPNHIKLQSNDTTNNNNDNEDEFINLINRALDRAIRRSNAVDLENLCIIAGEKVWELIIDLQVLNYDGNLIDSGCLAIITALLDFKKPDVTINNNNTSNSSSTSGGGNIIVHDDEMKRPFIELSILHIPICLTFLLFNLGSKETNLKTNEIDQEIWLLDGDAMEESCRDGYLIMTMNQNHELIQLSKIGGGGNNGGVSIDGQQLINLCNESIDEINRLTNLVKSTVKNHQLNRYNNENYKLLESSADR